MGLRLDAGAADDPNNRRRLIRRLVIGTTDKRRFELEALEQRCLLSGGTAACAAAPAAAASAVVVKEVLPGSAPQTSQAALNYSASSPVDSIFPAETQPANSPEKAPGATLSQGSGGSSAEASKDSVQSASAISATNPKQAPAQDASATGAAGGSQIQGSPATEQLTTTLKSANGPPSGADTSAGILLTNVPTFTQGPGGFTLIHVGGAAGPGVDPDGWDQINATGLAQLDGTLKIELDNGFVPSPGQKFKVLTWGSRSGEFTKWLGTTGIPGHPDYYFQPAYNDHDLTLEVVDDPNISNTAKSAIENGLNTLSHIGTLLNDVSDFAHTIPLIGDKLSSFLDSGAAFTKVLAEQIHNLFASAGNTAEAAVTSFIQSWDGTTVA